MQKTVLHNQNFLDFILHHCGSLESVFEIATENKLSITDNIKAAEVFNIPLKSYFENDVVNFYKYKGHIPATGQKMSKDDISQFTYEFAIEF